MSCNNGCKCKKAVNGAAVGALLLKDDPIGKYKTAVRAFMYLSNVFAAVPLAATGVLDVEDFICILEQLAGESLEA